ncbi:MAG: hypothetical protein FWC06_02320 [Treponema sp.]|nr:hypothetical protein [Treponema sp.]
MFSEKMDRSKISYGNKEIFDKDDSEYWKKATIKEKLQTITYLRECFYGKEATTGRLQRFYTLSKLKQG